MPTTPERFARDLLARAQQVTGAGILPPHLVIRLAYALGTSSIDDVVYLDVHLGPIGDRLTGQLAAYTSRHVAVVRFADVPRNACDASGDVAVAVLPRAALTRVEIVPVAGVDDSDAWRGGSLQSSYWPPAPVTFYYASLTEPLVLPRGRNAENLYTFYPSLLDDLTASRSREQSAGS